MLNKALTHIERTMPSSNFVTSIPRKSTEVLEVNKRLREILKKGDPSTEKEARDLVSTAVHTGQRPINVPSVRYAFEKTPFPTEFKRSLKRLESSSNRERETRDKILGRINR